MLVAAPVMPGVAVSYSRHIVFRIQSPLIAESSSLVVSTSHPGLVYTANDSGDYAVVYVLDRHGALVGRTTLANTRTHDIEAMAAGADGSLVVADIGDNGGDRSDLVAYRIPQPERGDHVVTPTRLALHYPNGAQDAESVIYDAPTERLYVVTKRFRGAAVYATPPRAFGQRAFGRGSVPLRPVAPAVALATDATRVPHSDRVIVRTYWDATVYSLPGWKRIDSFDLPNQKQGESIAAIPGGRRLWIGSEGKHSAVLSVALPQPPARQPTSGTTTGSTTPSADAQAETRDQRGQHIAGAVLIVGGAALVMALLILGRLVRRHRRVG
jgi:hypothetical protein